MLRKEKVFFMCVLATVVYICVLRANERLPSASSEAVQVNAFCDKPDLRFADSIAEYYMGSPRYECDILNQTSLIEIDDHLMNSTLFRILVRQGVLSGKTSLRYFYSMKLNMSGLTEYVNVMERDVTCTVESFDKVYNRSERWHLKMNNDTRTFEKIYNYTLFFAKHGFYFLSCNDTSGNLVYDDVYVIFPYEMSVLMKEKKHLRSLQVKTNNELDYEADVDDVEFLDTPNPLVFDRKMNVLMVAIDSMAYQQFRRTMPVTFDYLTNRLEHNLMFTDVNVVGDNTFPNLVPALTGIIVEDIPQINISSEWPRYKELDDDFFDRYPFIWNRYELSGYLTSFQEEQAGIGTFNYLKRGFRYRPTAFYGRPLWIKKYLLEYDDVDYTCKHGRFKYKTAFDMIERFMQRMNDIVNKNNPYFSFNFMSEYTHDDFVVSPDIDQTFTELLKRFEEKGYLDDTLLVIFSDHGHRLVSYAYKTETGQIEKNLPFISLRLPKRLRNTDYYLNAFNNRNKLVSAYDLYQTLRHFYHLNQNYSREMKKSQFAMNDKKNRKSRGISMFEVIPLNRSCSDALIPHSYCACIKRVSMNESQFNALTNLSFTQVGNFILDAINNITEVARKKCARYEQQEIQNFNNMNMNQNDLFKVVVSVEPNDAFFEANIRIDNNEMKIDGKIIRKSLYGNESHCVDDDAFLKNYCLCNNKALY